MPYVAACVLRIAGARVEPGTDITSAVSAWCESAVRTSIAAGTIVFKQRIASPNTRSWVALRTSNERLDGGPKDAFETPTGNERKTRCIS